MKFKEGDYVKIVAREVTAADLKTGLYYKHFSGLAGTVDRIYGEEICINVDPETLPDGILKRHTTTQEAIRRKWLDGLSGEARHRLTPEERQFNLAYTVLVQSDDLAKAKPGEVKPVAIKSIKPVVPAAEHVAEQPVETEAVAAEAPKATAAVKTPEAETAPAPKADDAPADGEKLTAAEIAFLQEREKALKSKK